MRQGRTLTQGVCEIIKIMIAYLEGIIKSNNSSNVILDVNGVGYGIFVSTEDRSKLKSDTNHKFYIYEHIREQSHDLFGFTVEGDKEFFEKLLGVNGVGPKMALNMLSIGSTSELRSAIASGDVKFIQQASGVGKKLAERIIIELKDKVGLASDVTAGDMLSGDHASIKDDATSGLIALGYSDYDARSALAKVSKDLSTEERIKQALKGNLK